jgi:hypothetical protein
MYEAVFETCEVGESVAIAEARLSADQRERVTTIEVEVNGRWDAFALWEALIPFQCFLVQRDQERWVVNARAPGCHGEQLPDALEAIEDWRAEQGARLPSCRVGGRPYQFREMRVA